MIQSYEQGDAISHGIDKAILIYYIKEKAAENKRLNKNYYLGDYYFFCSAKSLSLVFPWLSSSKIARLLRELVRDEILKSAVLSRHKSNRVKYYTIFVEKNLTQAEIKRNFKEEIKRENNRIENIFWEDWPEKYDPRPEGEN